MPRNAHLDVIHHTRQPPTRSAQAKRLISHAKRSCMNALPDAVAWHIDASEIPLTALMSLFLSLIMIMQYRDV